MQLKTTEIYSNVICESCNNELRSISTFRKDLIFKQQNLYSYVEGLYADEEISKEYEQNEVFEPSQTVSSIKNESSDNIEIKMEQTDAEDYSTFISTEYLETLQDDEEASGDYDESYAEDEEFSFVKKEKHQKSDIVRMKGLKKHYKRFVAFMIAKKFVVKIFL